MCKWTLFYRRLFYRNGHGIHSPFVYDLITNVVEERLQYYAYNDINRVRMHLRLNNQSIRFQGKESSIKHYLRKTALSRNEGEFLFRLTNHYKPYSILSVGSSMGLAPLYLTGYSSKLQCICLDSEPDIALIAQKNIDKKAKSPIQIIPGNYKHTTSEALEKFKRIDFLYISREIEEEVLKTVYDVCFPYLNEDSIVVISGIHASSCRKQFWEQVCSAPKITVSVDLYRMGLLFFHPKLHKRMYKSRMLK